MPSASQRVPVDCPFLSCRALTVHQHLPQLKYHNPRPGRAVHYRGYGNHNRDSSSKPSLVISLRIGSRDQGTAHLEPEVAEDGSVAQEENVNKQGVVLQGSTPEIHLSADDLVTPRLPLGVSDPDANREYVRDADDILLTLPKQEREGASSLFQAPITPPPSSPIAAEESSSSHNSQNPPEEQSEQEPATSPAAPMDIGDWLPGQGNAANRLTRHIHTYDELIRPLVDPTLAPAPGMAEITRMLREIQREDGDDPSLPSLMMRAPVTEYMRQFQGETDEEFDMETYMWQ